MDAWWSWFYEQLERKPSEKEAEMLKAALEETVEAPPGTEPRQSARLLQSRIGNRAMQQLMEMKAVQERIEEEQKAEQALDEQAVVAEPETAAPAAEVPPEEVPQTPAELVLPEAGEEPERKGGPAFLENLVEKEEEKPQRTAEEDLASALEAFLPTLKRGGGAHEWRTLTGLFAEAAPRSREELLGSIVTLFPKLEQTAQRVFLNKLSRWQRDSNDELAGLLWLRLAPLAQAQETTLEGGNGGGGNGSNG